MEYIIYLSLLFTGFVLGVFVGIYGVHRYQKHKTQKILNSVKQDLNGFLEKARKDFNNETRSTNDIQDRLLKVEKLQDELVNLAMSNSEPQRNALDGRHRQGQYGRFEQIQDEIKDILQSILDDGHDPTLIVAGPDGSEPVKLSEIMHREGFIGNKKEDEKTEEVGRVLKLVKPEPELTTSSKNEE